jgi:hypothetical protein
LNYAAWLSVHGEGEQQRLATDFVEYILQRAKEESERCVQKGSRRWWRRAGRGAP